jgi:hypothetical protein
MPEQIRFFTRPTTATGRQQTTRGSADRSVHTLTLQERATEEPVPPGRHLGHPIRVLQSTAAAFAMETYWSASGHAHTIDVLLARTTDPGEQQALRELRLAEHRRAAVARDALAEVWGFELHPPSAAMVLPEDVRPQTPQQQKLP